VPTTECKEGVADWRRDPFSYGKKVFSLAFHYVIVYKTNNFIPIERVSFANWKK